MQLNKNINRNLLKEQSFPSYNINNNEDCILHFGIGNFHRAHQALYIHEILENNKNISIIGVNLRSEETNNKMQLQNYLYSLVRISNNYKKVDILNPIKKVLFGLKHKSEIRNLIVSEKMYSDASKKFSNNERYLAHGVDLYKYLLKHKERISKLEELFKFKKLNKLFGTVYITSQMFLV